MEKENFNHISERLENYKYCSMEHVEYEDILEYEVILSNEDIILLLGYNAEAKLYEYHWAANDVKVLLQEVNKSNKKVLMTFIPDKWVDEFMKNEFEIYAVWNEYFNNNIVNSIESDEPIEILKDIAFKEASEVTLSCRGQSRGFSGQTEEWMKQWGEGIEPNLAAMKGKDSAVLIHREQGNIVGVICVAVYGHDYEKGAILWVREVAVKPEYQGRGIARKLLNQGMLYGKSHGAKRAFLMADECNKHAIRLYEKLGFVADKNEAEIDMIRK